MLRGALHAAATRRDRRASNGATGALLARIHRYTLNRLRAEIEPVTPADFMRFLFAWQHVDAGDAADRARRTARGRSRMLDGFELAAGAWERAVLPARVDRYEPAMLDMLCLAGEVGWARLSTPAAESRAARAGAGDAVALFLREHADAWQTLRTSRTIECRRCSAQPATRGSCSSVCATRGASFFSDLRARVRPRRRSARGTRSARWSPRAWPARTASPACAR